MAANDIRQYIGARYVFKIYENSQDPSSAEWESGAAYEPLTIVTYLNSTYASKKDVPATVGNPASNPLYWVVTGAYNGQIAALQQQIDAINNTTIPSIESAIQTLEYKTRNKKFIFIGDSYNTTDTPSGGVEILPWGPLVASYLGLGTNYYNSGVSGAGWTVGTTFMQQLESVYNNLTQSERDSITDIVVLGSVNDGANYSDVYDAITAFSNWVKTNLPNAIIWIGNCEWSRTDTLRNQMSTMEQWTDGKARLENVRVIGKLYRVYHLYDIYFQVDAHPNASGSRAIAGAVANVIKGGTINNAFTKDGDITFNTDLNVSAGTISFNEKLNGLNADLTISFPNSISLNYNMPLESSFTLGTIGLSSMYFATKTDIGQITLVLFDGTDYITALGNLSIEGSDLKMRIDRTGTASYATINITTILFASRMLHQSFSIDKC